jgi:hypothetical protein
VLVAAVECDLVGLVKFSALAICDHGEGFAVFVSTICQRMANGQRST